MLGENELALAYSVGDSSSTLWSVSATSATVHLLPARAELSPAIEMLRFGLQDPTRMDAAGYADVAGDLFDTLVAPAMGDIRAARRVLVLADDILHYIPFEALVSTRSDTWDGVRYLMDDLEVAYVPSATVLSQLRQRERPEATRDFLAIGNPDFTQTNDLSGLRGNALAALPFTAEEVASIAPLFTAGQTDILTGSAATESRVLEALSANTYRFVHFATHGLINDDRPDYSALALSVGETPGEGLLQASEIFNLSIPADLVVLSACETGLGQLVQGEGMVGLTRAFMYAGASALVVSLWSVSDASTSELMRHFYRRLIEREEDAAQALQQSKQVLARSPETAHPFHWAPFVLTGATR